MGYEDSLTVKLPVQPVSTEHFIGDFDDHAVSIISSGIDFGIEASLALLYIEKTYLSLSDEAVDFAKRMISALKSEKGVIIDCVTCGDAVVKNFEQAPNNSKKRSTTENVGAFAQNCMQIGATGIGIGVPLLAKLDVPPEVVDNLGTLYHVTKMGIGGIKACGICEEFQQENISSLKKEKAFITLVKTIAGFCLSLFYVLGFVAILPPLAIVSLSSKVWEKIVDGYIKLVENENKIHPLELKARKACIMNA